MAPQEGRGVQPLDSGTWAALLRWQRQLARGPWDPARDCSEIADEAARVAPGGEHWLCRPRRRGGTVRVHEEGRWEDRVYHMVYVVTAPDGRAMACDPRWDAVPVPFDEYRARLAAAQPDPAAVEWVPTDHIP